MSYEAKSLMLLLVVFLIFLAPVVWAILYDF